jgi:Zn-dependent M28 family amino/carboxypeptidase
VTSRNVVAILPGTTRPAETVLYGAHWDAYGIGPADARGDRIRNGAVDNAVGTATLLEIARAFARGPRPERSIVFALWTAEEKGLLGAEYYAATRFSRSRRQPRSSTSIPTSCSDPRATSI